MAQNEMRAKRGTPVHVRSNDGLGCRIFVAKHTMDLTTPPTCRENVGRHVAEEARSVDMSGACLGVRETATAFALVRSPRQSGQ